jgi:hypothetical protein
MGSEPTPRNELAGSNPVWSTNTEHGMFTMKPRMRHVGQHWVCWHDGVYGVGKTMDEAWMAYHGERGHINRIYGSER